MFGLIESSIIIVILRAHSLISVNWSRITCVPSEYRPEVRLFSALGETQLPEFYQTKWSFPPAVDSSVFRTIDPASVPHASCSRLRPTSLLYMIISTLHLDPSGYGTSWIIFEVSTYCVSCKTSWVHGGAQKVNLARSGRYVHMIYFTFQHQKYSRFTMENSEDIKTQESQAKLQHGMRKTPSTQDGVQYLTCRVPPR